MNFQGTVECFRFTFGVLVFALPESFLSRVMCIKMFEKAPGRWNELASDDFPNTLKLLNTLGPFESVDDHLYKARMFVHANGGRVLENIAEVFEEDSEKMPRKKADEQTKRFNEREETINGRINQVNGFEQAQTTNAFLPRDDTFSPDSYKTLRDEINKIKLQVKKLKQIFRVASNLLEVENFSLECLEKLIGGIKQGMREELNRVTINNRFQMNSVFLVNGLSTEDKRKNSDAQLAPLTEVLDNLKEYSSTDSMKLFHDANKPYDLELLKALQKNFSKMFHNQHVTLEQINKMYEIVEFIERYRGLVGSLKGLDVNGEELIKKIEQKVVEEARRVWT